MVTAQTFAGERVVIFKYSTLFVKAHFNYIISYPVRSIKTVVF